MGAPLCRHSLRAPGVCCSDGLNWSHQRIVLICLWLVVYDYYRRIAVRPRSERLRTRVETRFLPDFRGILRSNYRQLLQRLRGNSTPTPSPTAELQNVQNQNVENTML
ncbi:hypothetical protein C0J52_00192 [Blattella germanica]|nr:hypothetical protein C0J52_00192 [Blattella germanica]